MSFNSEALVEVPFVGDSSPSETFETHASESFETHSEPSVEKSEPIPFDHQYIEIQNPLFEPPKMADREGEGDRNGDGQGERQIVNQPKSMRDYLHPNRSTPLGPIVFPAETQEARNAFTVKPGTCLLYTSPSPRDCS